MVLSANRIILFSYGYTTIHKKSTRNCDQCDNTFKDKNTLNRHKHYKHEVVKYDCDQCDECFTLNGILINHKKPNLMLLW